MIIANKRYNQVQSIPFFLLLVDVVFHQRKKVFVLKMYYFISQDIIITTCINGRLLSPFCLASVQVLAPHLVPADGDFVF